MRPRSVVVSLVVGMLTVAAFGGSLTCYEYPMESLTLVHAYANASGDTSKEILDKQQYRFLLAVPEKLNRLKHHTFFLYHGEKMLEYNAMECYDFRGTTGGYVCQGECDSGHVIVAADHRLRSREGVLFGESIDAPEGDWTVKWRSPGSLISPREVSCPPEVSQNIAASGSDFVVSEAYIKQREKYSATLTYQYVCYGKKELRLVQGKWHPLYSDCEISSNTCEEMGMERFGHYGTEKAARKALTRCQHSAPRVQ